MRKYSICILLLCILGLLAGCQADRITDDPTCRLAFSKDTVLFDTVFTTIGSSTQTLMVINPNKNALRIERVGLASGRYFRVNVNGEPLDGGSSTSQEAAVTIAGGDSIFVFIRATIDPQDSNSPVFIRDTLLFGLSQGIQQVILEAYGQDVVLIRSAKRRTEYARDFVFKHDKPYLIYDSVLVGGKMTIEAGATLYMHQGSAIFGLGDVEAVGTLTQPVTLRGDRLDRLFDSVPYRYAAGMWDGLYLLNYKDAPCAAYAFDYLHCEGGNIGLYCYSERTQDLPSLTLSNSRIHNHALYGVVLQNTNATIANNEISNCASYCLYLDGGEFDIVHTTIASYFGATNVNIQSTQKEDVAGVYINNLSKTGAATHVNVRNSIITGSRRNQLVLATPLPQYYAGAWYGNYIKTDSLTIPHAHDNIYWSEDDTVEVFRNTYYKYNEYRYYDFRLDSLSPARGIGDSIPALSYPIDRNGFSREHVRPDAGCYQYAE
ncbi:MAG: right-handed parallel beta-helix repeat-containing protein [Paludibacteraceae bacterium]